MNKPIILWADDDPDDIAIIRDVLQDINSSFQLIAVPNGQKALDYLQQVTQSSSLPCLIVLDMNMPVLSGRDTLAILKKQPQYNNVPMVVFTTSNSPLDRLFCQCYHVEMFTKPTSYNALKEIIPKLLRLSSISSNHTCSPKP